jgi:hypothetical protein
MQFPLVTMDVTAAAATVSSVTSTDTDTDSNMIQEFTESNRCGEPLSASEEGKIREWLTEGHEAKEVRDRTCSFLNPYRLPLFEAVLGVPTKGRKKFPAPVVSIALSRENMIVFHNHKDVQLPEQHGYVVTDDDMLVKMVKKGPVDFGGSGVKLTVSKMPEWIAHVKKVQSDCTSHSTAVYQADARRVDAVADDTDMVDAPVLNPSSSSAAMKRPPTQMVQRHKMSAVFLT